MMNKNSFSVGHILRSKTKISRYRFSAKCNRCDAVMSNKPFRMKKYLLSVCKMSFKDQYKVSNVSSLSVGGQSITNDQTAGTVVKMRKGNRNAFYTADVEN